ncbi:MAG: ATP-binding protein [Flavobacteriales bacterium]|nr:ATP-binding protein [Flavobacteriales bacterium]|tara:strand:+ start:4123 stop:4809 length:687 start_codon:yes stop_codon:yes gene_type:complete
MKKTFLNWSSGKDCAMALHLMQKSGEYKVQKLFTTVGKDEKRIGMHGLREEVLKRQAAAIGLPLEIAYLSKDDSHKAYNQLMREKMTKLVGEGFQFAAYGDILLEDLRAYREKQLSEVGMKAHFPLWQKNTRELLLDFIDKGFKAIVVAASGNYFDNSVLGKEMNRDFLNELPKEVDPCGENGEFHTFCYDGPIFKQSIDFSKGRKVVKKYANPSGKGCVKFHFLDIM